MSGGDGASGDPRPESAAGAPRGPDPGAPADSTRRIPGPLTLLRAGLPLAALAGAIAGAAFGGRYLAAGFPLLTVDSALSGLLRAAVGATGFSAVYALVARPLERRLQPWLATALAALAGAAPWIALGGYHLERRWGLRPADLLTGRGLRLNLGYLAACIAALAAIAWLLGRWRRRAPRVGWLPSLATAAVAAAVAGALALAWRSGGEPERPDVLVLLVDALRADEPSFAGYPRPTTPAIDALVADGVVFSQAVAASTFTKSSVASLFTGRFPYQHGVYWGSRRLDSGALVADRLPAREITLAEVLRRRGWLTRAWVQNGHLVARMGFAQGFVDYRDSQGSIGRIHRQVLPFLRGPGHRYPFFAYLHYIDLHDPYRPEPPYDALFGDGADPYEGIDLGRWGEYLEAVRRGEVRPEPERVERMRAAYDGQLRAIDDQIGLLLAELKRLGRYDSTLIVLTADHGDAFYEHGFIGHSTVPYDELVRVPLVIKLPGGRFADESVAVQARLVDLMPTLLAALGVDPPAGVAGCNLLALVRGGEPPAECGRAVIEIAEEGAYPVVALRTERWKYIHHQHRGDELYDLEADPAERDDLLAPAAGPPPPAAEELHRAALAVVAARAANAESPVELDAATIRELKALGYL